MVILKYSLNNPVKVFVAVLFVLLFGTQALLNMPYQLNPTVEYPTITIRTTWTGATPYEVEREIVDRQEDVLKSLAGLLEMESTSSNGSGSVTLQFELGTSLMDAMLLVTNKLNEVRTYPENVNKPVIRASGADSSPVVYMFFTINDGNDRVIDSYRTYVEDEIVPKFERVKGVSDIFFYGGRPTQMHVTVIPDKMAAYNISLDQLANTLTQENVNISGGLLPVGRKNYRVRTVSEFRSVEDIQETLILSNSGSVKVSDIANIDYGYATSDSAVRYAGNRTMMIGVVAEAGANVLDLTDEVERIAQELNNGVLKDEGIALKWFYDQRPYIKGAIELVKGNIIMGGLLAIAVLLIFLRSVSSTIIVATSIPISIMGTFVVLSLLGRTLNVISLAGISFAVSMLIDNAIVVLENIDRHRKMGKTAMDATYDGAVEVWGAILASTITTVAVFLPVVFIKQEAGQLFRDIAIAISSATILSLLVSLLAIPVFTKLLYQYMPTSKPMKLGDKIASIGGVMGERIMQLSNWINISTPRRWVVIVVLSGFSILTTWVLYPKMEYLPQGNMNMVQTSFIMPGGLSLDERSELGDMFYGYLKEHIGVEKDGYPAIAEFSYNVNTGGMFTMATAVDSERAAELVPLLTEKMKLIPGVRGFTSQSGIFQTRSGGGRSIDVVVSGDDLDYLVNATRKIVQAIPQVAPNTQVRPRPSLDMLYPEAIFRPDYQRMKDVGLTPTSLGNALSVYVDGRKVSEYKDEKLGNIDLVVNIPQKTVNNPEELAFLPIILPTGVAVPISSVSDTELGFGMDGIRHYERNRTFTLTVSPPPDVVLEDLMIRIQEQVVKPLADNGSLSGVEVHYAGSASRLTQAKEALMGNFILALIITYLLMVALFDNFFYPLIIMFTVPLAVAGGFIGLKLVDTFITPQSFDVLTMLGFILLIGVVVNNAILIVHQSLNNTKVHNMGHQEAISEAVSSRLRPIFMSAATSLFGLLPLVLFPGPGSELYRGLGSVVLGGLTISTIFTIFMIPAQLSLVMGMKKIKAKE